MTEEIAALVSAARRGDQAGHYVASMTLPRQGEWQFVIDSKICGNTCTLSPMTALAAATPLKRTKGN